MAAAPTALTALAAAILGLIALTASIPTTHAEIILNPDGYIIGKYYQYASCTGDVASVQAWALNKCVFSGLMGYPFANTYIRLVPYVLNGDDYVTFYSYWDSECSDQMNTIEDMPLGSCTDAGSAINFYSSSTMPDWSSFDNGYVLQQTYNFTGNSNTCSGESELLTAGWYPDTCQFNCGSGGASCQWMGCAAQYNVTGGAALLSLYDEEYCPSADFTSTVFVPSTCSQSITCLSSSAEAKGLSTAAAAGITFAATFVGFIVVASLVYFCFLRKRITFSRVPAGTTPPTSALVEPINHGAPIQNAIYVPPTAPEWETERSKA
jgi:hypothetical protein